MHLLAQYQEQEDKAREAMESVNECYKKMKSIRETMLAAGAPDPESIYCQYGVDARRVARANVNRIIGQNNYQSIKMERKS